MDNRQAIGGKGIGMEIGSIYEINPNMAEAALKCNPAKLNLKEVQKYGKKYSVYTASGREAIGLSLKSLEENRPDIDRKCLLPAYMCDSVFFPFIHRGWELHFYHVGKNLRADKEELSRQIEHIRPGLLFIHAYYGADTWKPMRSFLRQWRKRGIVIMEDVTQSYYRTDIGREADYVVGSLRKWYPVPDGGFAASDIPVSGEGLKKSGEFSEKRMELLTEKWRYLYGDDSGEPEERDAVKQEYLRKNRETEEWLDRHSELNTMSDIANGILEAAEEEPYKEQRKENYRRLYEAMTEMEYCVPVFGRDTETEAPLYFPVYADDREDLQRFLGRNDIYAPVLWPVGKENKNCLSEDERYIYSHLLALPIDQRYGGEAMEQVVRTLKDYEYRREG